MNCENCRVGHLTPIVTNYITVIDETVLIIPNIAAMDCDVCGSLMYDETVLGKVDYLLAHGVETRDRFLPLESQPASRQRIAGMQIM